MLSLDDVQVVLDGHTSGSMSSLVSSAATDIGLSSSKRSPLRVKSLHQTTLRRR